LQKVLQLLSEYNARSDTLSSDFNVSAFVLGNNRLAPRQNIDTAVINQAPELTGGDAGYRPYVMGIWGTWCNVDGGSYSNEAKKFFKELDSVQSIGGQVSEILMGLVGSLTHDDKVPLVTADKPTPMSALTKMYGFPERVQANPYVSATWCGNVKNTNTNGFAKWAAEVTDQVYQVEGTYADFEWVVCGGKHSQNIIGAKENPTAVAWRDTDMLCFQYVHFDNTKDGKDWKYPEEFSLKWVDECRKGAIGPKGCIGTVDRQWNAFPVQAENLDENKKIFFQNEQVYQKVLATKRRFDPDNIFTPNKFCVGASQLKN